MGRILLACLLAGLFLLLLSALVVAPEAEAPIAEAAPLVGARLLPLALPAPSATGAEEGRQLSLWVALWLLPCALPVLPGLTARRDANGRVLQARRYENSFYQVFKPEVAGG